MKEENEKNKRRKGDPATDGEQTEHKDNWRKTYASAVEIQRMLSDSLYLRYNLVTRRTECRVPESDYFQAHPDAPMLLKPTQEWQPIDDRLENTLWATLSQHKPVRPQDLHRVIASHFAPDFHPFRYYLQHLPPWNGEDYIAELSASVSVKGSLDEQVLFYEYLKKWLVAMVAGWLDEAVVNNVILVLIGEQGSYKTTWFSHLLPPELRQYFRIKTNASVTTRDDLLSLTQYGLVCYEELDTMTSKESNQLKSAVTMPSVDERAPYDRFPVHRPHIASFCGTGNNVQFLTDETGSRRWLPFEVASILSPRENPFNYEGIYAQAYALSRDRDFRYYFSQAETSRLMQHNATFEAAHNELELVDFYFRQPTAGETGEFMPTAVALQIVSGGISHKLSTVALGRAFSKLGFRSDTIGRIRGYYVVRLNDDERRARQRMKAHETAGGTQITDDADAF